MCEISKSLVQRFQSWYFPDKPYLAFESDMYNVFNKISS